MQVPEAVLGEIGAAPAGAEGGSQLLLPTTGQSMPYSIPGLVALILVVIGAGLRRVVPLKQAAPANADSYFQQLQAQEASIRDRFDRNKS